MIKIADAHCDFLSFNVIKDDKTRLFDHADLNRFLRGGVALQVFAVWTPPELENAADISFLQIDFFKKFILDSNGRAILCTDKAHFFNTHDVLAIIAIEGGASLECNLQAIYCAYEQGARMLSLTWNEENDFAFGCEYNTGGIKPKGYKAIEVLNSLNMALDLSHINEQGFFEAVEAYKSAPCASHSCAYHICKSPRNLKDEQIAAIINRKGFIGINFYNDFLGGDDVHKVLEHVEHVLGLGGGDAVGFGSDFCGIDKTPKNLNSVADYQLLPEAMSQRGYSDGLIKKICYGNFASYIIQFL